MVQNGALRIFRAFGVNVYLHWSWVLIAVIEIQFRNNAYASQLWNILEYLTLFAIVLLHEFGHALACRSVGGQADRIMLWPLGGVAYVSPPPRPGALLWSIAAGPLVNLALLPVTIAAFVAFRASLPGASHDAHHYLFSIAVINVALLAFNLLPVYPLDGGQILRAVLWFFVGRSRSLSIAAAIGLVGAVVGVAVAGWLGDAWLVVLAFYAALRSWSGLKAARALAAALATPRHVGVQCPACQEPAPIGPLWRCSCGAVFDTFLAQRTCPRCGSVSDQTGCPFCGQASPFVAWYRPGGGKPVIAEARIGDSGNSAY